MEKQNVILTLKVTVQIYLNQHTSHTVGRKGSYKENVKKCQVSSRVKVKMPHTLNSIFRKLLVIKILYLHVHQQN